MAQVTIVRHEPCPVDVFLVELVKAYFPRLLMRNFFGRLTPCRQGPEALQT